jgi:hypothetical protein
MDPEEAMNAMMPDLHDLEILLRSDTPIVLIESIEEPRVVELFAGLLGEIANTQPLSVVMHGQLEALRAWASGRTVQAHAPEEQDDASAVALDDAAEAAFARMASAGKSAGEPPREQPE